MAQLDSWIVRLSGRTKWNGYDIRPESFPDGVANVCDNSIKVFDPWARWVLSPLSFWTVGVLLRRK